MVPVAAVITAPAPTVTVAAVDFITRTSDPELRITPVFVVSAVFDAIVPAAIKPVEPVVAEI